MNKKEKIKEYQKNIIKKWFYENYEDPAENCPYDDGEYIYIYGGPYSADDIIHDEFDGVFPKTPINEVIEELNNECIDWSAIPSDDWFNNEYISPYQNYKDQLVQIKEILNITVTQEIENSFYKMIYASIITLLETYLHDTFVKKVYIGNSMDTFLNKNTDILNKKYTLCEIYKQYNLINQEVQNYLSDILWHNLSKINMLYKSTFDVPLPPFGNLIKAITRRHDIVHRNGKDKHDIECYTYRKDVIELIDIVDNFIEQLEQNFEEKDKLELDKLTKDLIEDF